MSKFGTRSNSAPAGNRFAAPNSAPRPQTTGQKSKFANIGSLTVTKKTVEKLGEGVKADLKNSGITVSASIYLPKGQETLTLRNKDTILIMFKEVTGKDGAPLMSKNGTPLDFLVGQLVLPLE